MDGQVIWQWQVFSQTRGAQAEKVLLARCRAGKRAAFDLLLERYRDRVLNLAFQMLHDANAAEDVAQEVFVSAFTGIKHFRGEATLFTWLYRMTINHCNRRRKRNSTWLKAEQNSIELYTNIASLEFTAICHIAEWLPRLLSAIAVTGSLVYLILAWSVLNPHQSARANILNMFRNGEVHQLQMIEQTQKSSDSSNQ